MRQDNLQRAERQVVGAASVYRFVYIAEAGEVKEPKGSRGQGDDQVLAAKPALADEMKTT